MQAPTPSPRSAPVSLYRVMCALLTAAVGLLAWAMPLGAQADESGGADEAPVLELARLVRWTGVATSLVLILVVYFGLKFVDRLIVGLGETFTDRRLALQKAGTFLRFGTYMLTALVVFFVSFEVDQRLLTLMGGTAAVALGFALKDLVASIVAGIMIMIDRPFQVGDRVMFGGEYGDITSIGLRSVRLQTLTDNTVTIPNNKFLSDLTASGNYGALDMMVCMEFFVGIEEDFHLARDLVRQAAATSRYVYLPKPITIVVKQVIVDSYVAIRLTLKAYVMDTQYEKAFESDVNMRVLEAFRKNSIQPPAVLHRPLGEISSAMRVAS